MTKVKEGKVKAIAIDYISKTSIGSVSGSETEIENVPSVKKISLREGVQKPYISSQALKHYIRVIWEERGIELSVPPSKIEQEQGVKSKLDPLKYIDDDLFGFMFEEKSRRTAPVRIKPGHGNLVYLGDRDYGTGPHPTQAGEKTIFETEIYHNYFSNTVLIEVDRIGCGIDARENFKGKECDKTVKLQRLTFLFEAIRDLWGGGRQSRFLTDISPKFVIISCLNVKKPYLLEVIGTDEEGNIRIDDIKSAISEHDDIIDKKFIGISDGVFPNKDIACKEFQDVLTTRQAFNKVIEQLKNLF